MIINQRKAGVIFSYIGEVVKILTGLIYTPIMLRLLGQSEYGLYQLVYSVVSYLSLLSLGFGSAYMRFYSRYKANDDTKGISKLNGMFAVIFCSISVICILCGLVLVNNAKVVFGTGLTEAELYKSKVLLSFMVVNLALTFPNTIFNNIITANERFLFQKLLILLQNLLTPFITVPLLIMGYNSVAVVIIQTILTVFVLVLNIYYCFAKLHAVFCFRGFQISLFKEMWIFTFFLFLNQIIDQINWNAGKFLLGRFAGTISVAVYGAGTQINTMYMHTSSAVSNVFVPRVNRIVAEMGDDNALTQLFTRIGRVQFIMLSLVLTGFVFFGKPFVQFWAGSGYQDTYYVVLLLIFPATIPLIQNIGIEIQRAKNKHKARSVVYFCIAIVNILISIPCIKIFGSVGAAIGTAVSLFVGNGLFMNWYYHKKIGIDIIYFWKEIIKFIPSLILPCISGWLMMKSVKYDSLFKLAIGISVYTMIYCTSMWFFGMNNYEKSLVSKKIGKRVKG